MLTCLLVARADSQGVSSSLPILTKADQIRQLTPEQAAAGYPVKIRGVVTGDVPAPDFFVQDSTAGIFVEGRDSSLPHHFGDLVEVTGITGPGKFAPVLREQATTVIGKGQLPTARTYGFRELSMGQLDSQWVKVRGVVRSVAIDTQSWKEMTVAMRIASDEGEFVARVPIDHPQDFSAWVDSEVMVEGVCGSLFTAQRQLSGILFYVPQLSLIRVETPAKEIPITALLQFSPGLQEQHRVRIRGVVEYQEPGDVLFVQSDSRGLRVLGQHDAHLEPGDRVDVMGWPAVGESAPVLTDAVYHRLGPGKPPEPSPLNLDLPWEQYDADLVSLDATLLDRQHVGASFRLLLKAGESLFEATLPNDGDDRLVRIPLNSEVRATGICLVRSGGLWSVPQSFRLLLRSPADIQVLTAAPWWNLRRSLWALGITLAVLLIVMVWVVVLGRRVREQMAIIRQKLQSSAVLEERNRIARELHDTVEQELAGITMQLDLAVDCMEQAPRVARKAVETARDMSRHSLIEARRSVWDLRCQLLEDGDLISALDQLIRPFVPDGGPEITMQIQGTPERLAAATEMNLLRIGQEAVANAVKHGRAQHIRVDLLYGADTVQLLVTDDGEGFQPSAHSSSGHFGLLDMRERAHFMGSELAIDSHPGRGTRLSVTVPREKHTSDEALETHTHSGR
jgi:signal transduction histidine kinase